MIKKDEVKKDVKFTLPLSHDLNKAVKEKAEDIGLSKIAYIRMILSKAVKEN